VVIALSCPPQIGNEIFNRENACFRTHLLGVYIFTKYMQGQIRVHFSQVIVVGMRRLRAVATFFLVPAKQMP